MDLPISKRITIPARDLEWQASRSGGPGGQNVNKVSTKIDLRFDLEHTSALSIPVKNRLRSLAKGRIDAEGRLVIVSTATRSQMANLEDARERLRELIAAALVAPKIRRATKPSRGSQRRRLDAKRRNSDKKKSRGKVDY